MIEKKMIEFIEAMMKIARKSTKEEVVEGAILGQHFPARGINEKVWLPDKGRLEHLYVLGATGMGKTKLIESLIRQDVQSRNGFCLIDPHGDLIHNILKYIGSVAGAAQSPLTHKAAGKKLILVEPFNTESAVGFNPLEASSTDPYPLVMELMGIFKRIWHDSHWGPRMDELLRNTFLTLAYNKLTLLEVRRLLTDRSFRLRLVEKVSSSEVREYWFSRYDSLSDKMQAIYREPILNRLSIFTADSTVRSIIGQSKSSFNFRDAMDSGKWLLINLSKGHLKENTHLLGALFIAKLQNAAMSRVDIPEHRRKPFYLYVDEFQNFIGEDFKTVLSEARKYGLGLTLAHQNLAQLETDLRAAILGNAGSKIIFRVSHRDAAIMAPELNQREKIPIEKALVQLTKRLAYFKKQGVRQVQFITNNVHEPRTDSGLITRIKNESISNYAKSKVEVERDIQKRSKEGISASSNISKPDALKSKLTPRKDFEEGLDGW